MFLYTRRYRMQPFIVETKVTLKVVRTAVKRVLIYSKIQNATLYSGNKGHFESGQNSSKACSYYTQRYRMQPFVRYHRHTSCKLYFKRDNILQVRTSNSLLDYQLPCPPLSCPDLSPLSAPDPYEPLPGNQGATMVSVSTSAFLTCHQC